MYISNTNLLNTDNTNAVWYRVLNPTLTGASFSDYNAATSIVQVDVNATAVSGGTVVFAGFVSASTTQRRAIADNVLNSCCRSYTHHSTAYKIQ